MKKVILFLILISLSIIGCHTDTPTGIDTVDPTVEILKMSSADSVFYEKDSNFVDFADTLFDGFNYSLNASASDNDEVYKVSLYAVDFATSKRKLIKEIKRPFFKFVTFNFTVRDFPDFIDNPVEKGYFAIDALDATDRVVHSAKELGFYVSKQHPLQVFSSELGKRMEVEGDSIDFADFTSKLTFIQFHGYNCGSCHNEAMEFKEFYESHSDHSKYTIELFGSEAYGMTFEYAKEEIKEKYSLPYDCFFDENQDVKHFLLKYLKKISNISIVENDIFAVFPNGKIERYDQYDPNADFPKWIDEMYNEL